MAKISVIPTNSGTIKECQLELNSKLWISANEETVYCKGTASLLRFIDQTGSIRSASVAMNISYAKAVTILRMTEKQLDCKILFTKRGGKNGGKNGGGSSILTKAGRDLMMRYDLFCKEANDLIQESFNKHFDGVFLGEEE